MFNWSLHSFSAAIQLLRQELLEAVRAEHGMRAYLPEDYDRLIANLQAIERACANLSLQSADHRLGRLFTDLRTRTPSPAYLAHELPVLLEAIEDDVRTEYFFHYRRDKALLFPRIVSDWAQTLRRFPSTAPEIEEGVDCYALEHNTACVFHMMRIAEQGLRALSRERQVSFARKPLEWATWQEMLDQIESSGRAAARALPAGIQRDAALAFYSGATGQIHGFKDTFRNVVMHVRRSYDELDALKAINQVRDFMNGLSAKIGEKTKSPIRRWP